jgi:hypothetical protein
MPFGLAIVVGRVDGAGKRWNRADHREHFPLAQRRPAAFISVCGKAEQCLASMGSAAVT